MESGAGAGATPSPPKAAKASRARRKTPPEKKGRSIRGGGGAGGGGGGLLPIASFTRIKPLAGRTDAGGTASATQLAGWTETTIEAGGCTYDHSAAVLAPDATQQHVYETIAQPLIRAWLDGFDVDLICYGQTGSGKTYTMFGPPFSMEKAAKALEDTAIAFPLASPNFPTRILFISLQDVQIPIATKIMKKGCR